MDFGTIFAALVIGHYLADFWVQTDHQSRHKGLKGPDSWCGRWNAFKHAVTYTATVWGVLAAVLSATGAGFGQHTAAVVTAALVVNGITHYVIDRRWTLEALARKLGKGTWIDNDKSAMMHLDQAAHLAIFGPVALAICALA
jgi:hypothetical protein